MHILDPAFLGPVVAAIIGLIAAIIIYFKNKANGNTQTVGNVKSKEGNVNINQTQNIKTPKNWYYGYF